ncbi:hypothetical protein [uncultured Algibacter sp.]|uniref:hypothetical protein n=1 Tax=uncultured Algibacter sp. TaxID=298659 RepID=UPI002611BA8D|nr:hypothetical protein [uncultured Algibacter sp.]
MNYNNGIELEFDNGNDDIQKYVLENKKNTRLIFKNLDKENDYLTLIKLDSIKRNDLKIEEIHLKVTPFYLYSGILEFNIKKDKKITYRKGDIVKSELETKTLSDSTFDQIEQYLEILEFDEYNDKYRFGGHDGAQYNLTIRTNRYTKTIESIQFPTEGIRNFISFIDYKLETE